MPAFGDVGFPGGALRYDHHAGGGVGVNDDDHPGHPHAVVGRNVAGAYVKDGSERVALEIETRDGGHADGLGMVPVGLVEGNERVAGIVVDHRELIIVVAECDVHPLAAVEGLGQDDLVGVFNAGLAHRGQAAALDDCRAGTVRIDDLVDLRVEVEMDHAGGVWIAAQLEAAEVEVSVHDRPRLAVDEDRLNPAGGEQIGSEHAVQTLGDVEHEPLQVGPHQVDTLLGGNVDLVEQEHRSGNLAADAPDRLPPGEVGVPFAQRAVQVGVQPDIDAQLFGDHA